MRMRWRVALWIAAVAFAVAIGVPAFVIFAFPEGPGVRPAGQLATAAFAAVVLGFGSQLGLMLAPLVAGRGAVARGVVSALMLPMLLTGALGLVESAFWLASGAGGALFQTGRPYYALMAPIYIAVLGWLWRRPHPGAVPEPTA